MPSLFRKGNTKVGLPPGTMVHIGQKRQQKTKISIFDYSLDSYEEKVVYDIEESYIYRDKKSVTWINIDGLEDLQIIEKINKHYGVHELVLEDIVNTGSRPKFEDHESFLFLILKMFEHDPKTGDLNSEQISIIQGANYVISFQETEGDIFDHIRDRIRTNKGRVRKMGADYLSYLLMDSIVDYCFIVLEHVGANMEALEEKMMKEVDPSMTEEIHYLKKDMIYLRKLVWPFREVANGLQRTENKLITKSIHVFLRDVYDHTIQVMDTIDSYRDIVSGLHDIYLSSMSNKMNEIMKVLTTFSAVFIPLTFIAGVYGMNFEYMPELKAKNGYYILLGVMSAISIAMLLFFRRKKWL